MTLEILSSGVKRNRKTPGSFVTDVSDVLDRPKGLHLTIDCGIEMASWMHIAPLPCPTHSLINQGQVLLKNSKPLYPPFEVFKQTFLQWNRTEAFGRSFHKSIREGWSALEMMKVLVAVKDFFSWGFGVVSWGARMISYAGDAFLRKISCPLPQIIAKIGAAAGVPSFGFVVVTQSSHCIEAILLPKAKNPLLREDQSGTLEVMLYQLASSVARLGSFVLQGARVFSLASFPVPYLLPFTSIGLIFNVIAIQRGEGLHRPRVYVRQTA